MIWHFDTVAIMCLVIFCLILLSLAISLQRRRRNGPRSRIRRWAGPITQPSARETQDALKQLYTVAQKISQSSYKPDDETECPICLASFSRRSEECDRRPHAAEVDLEAGLGAPDTSGTATGGTPKRPAPSKKGKKGCEVQPDEKEILRINGCGHIFHSCCLANWFLRGKYDCPLCRSVYYRPREQQGQQQGQQQSRQQSRQQSQT